MKEALDRQRGKSKLSVEKLSEFLYESQLPRIHKVIEFLHERYPPELNTINEGRLHMVKQSIRQGQSINVLRFDDDAPMSAVFLHSQYQQPNIGHYRMFIPCLKIMGTQDLISEFLDRALRFEIVGCYAQTELGHGSDVQSLMTTATYDQSTEEFIMDTPCIQAIKFWPGDLGIYATHAMVFARLLVKGKDHGVHPFIVPIRDSQRQALPGVECGDIGPKYAFHSRDNGFLRLNAVRIPRRYMLQKSTSVSKEGIVNTTGNPRLVYATMMIVRRAISTTWPKIYAQGLTIACRYSIFRKQFKDESGNEIPIIDYQTQQNKLIPLVAEYYALTVMGSTISKLTDDNFDRVIRRNDDSLMAETHATLCSGKAYSSDVVHRGLEICRLSCGGHGFSQYSGLPAIVADYAGNITYEGENTVMQLQAARYVLKCFQNSVTKKKEPLQSSVDYLKQFQELVARKCSVSGAQGWNLENLKILLSQSVCLSLQCIKQIQSSSKDVPSNDLSNKMGLRLAELSTLHAAYNTFANFEQALTKVTDAQIQQVLLQLCLLYGIGCILERPLQLIQASVLSSEQVAALRAKKMSLIGELRPHLLVLIDGCGVPDKTLKSLIATGDDIYEVKTFIMQAMLTEARTNNSLNLHGGCLEAADIVRHGVPRSRL